MWTKYCKSVDIINHIYCPFLHVKGFCPGASVRLLVAPPPTLPVAPRCAASVFSSSVMAPPLAWAGLTTAVRRGVKSELLLKGIWKYIDTSVERKRSSRSVELIKCWMYLSTQVVSFVLVGGWVRSSTHFTLPPALTIVWPQYHDTTNPKSVVGHTFSIDNDIVHLFTSSMPKQTVLIWSEPWSMNQNYLWWVSGCKQVHSLRLSSK